MTDIVEIWKPVNHDALRDEWEISSYGRMGEKKTHTIFNCDWKDDKGKGYAHKIINTERYRVHILVALTFVPNPSSLPFVDHLDRCKWNNHASNLRWCTTGMNLANATKRSNLTSQFKGVHKLGEKWIASIHPEYTTQYLGTYDTEEMAAAAYNASARVFFGEFAVLNAVDEILEKQFPARKVKKSKYRGVYWVEKNQKWKVAIRHENRTRNIGAFATEREAALAFNKAAIRVRGEKAKLNLVD
jgi:hypothetical protein